MSDQVEDEVCAICFDPMNNKANHRLVSIKCGHVFGEKCIRKSFNIRPECPLCATRWKLRDIRYHYATNMRNDDINRLRGLKEGYRKLRKKMSAKKRLLKTAQGELESVSRSVALMANRNAKLAEEVDMLKLELEIVRTSDPKVYPIQITINQSPIRRERKRAEEEASRRQVGQQSTIWLSSGTSITSSTTSCSSNTECSSESESGAPSLKSGPQTLVSPSLGSFWR